jgi:HPt (histidine-containing phosphotransfer) domain-containing protein
VFARAWPEVLDLDAQEQDLSARNEAIITGTWEIQGTRFIHLKSEGFDPESLWARVDGDLDLLRELVDVFAEEAPKMLTRIQEGIDLQSPSEVEKAGHKLKGSVLQFSARTAAATALELEEKGREGSLAGANPLLDKLRQEIDLLQEALNAMVSGSGPR